MMNYLVTSLNTSFDKINEEDEEQDSEKEMEIDIDNSIDDELENDDDSIESNSTTPDNTSSSASSSSSTSFFSYYFPSNSICTKSICRYSWGCTHKNDPLHREKFWHPKIYYNDDEVVSKSFICYECGFATTSQLELQIHIKSKTAWSNTELVGSRICILVDSKEWHEAYVKDYRSKKHLIYFKYCNEKRWLNLLQHNFYIIERPPLVECEDSIKYYTQSSIKKNYNNKSKNKTNFYSDKSIYSTYSSENPWNYSEEISLDYVFAQSCLYKIYGSNIQETGHLTQGHLCLSNKDEENAKISASSLLYGELLPRGLNKAMQKNRLYFSQSSVVFELGMGTGKIAIQSFLQYLNLKYVFGIELSKNRYEIAEIALLNMVYLLGKENFLIERKEGEYIIVKELKKSKFKADNNTEENINKNENNILRVIHFQCGNLFSLKSLEFADIVMMETDIPKELYPNLYILLQTMKEKSRILSYIDFTALYQERKEMSLNSTNNFNQCPNNFSYYLFDFEQLNENKSLGDRYSTSWSVQRGHHFYLWKKLRTSNESLIKKIQKSKNYNKIKFIKNYNENKSDILGRNDTIKSEDESLSINNNPECKYYNIKKKDYLLNNFSSSNSYNYYFNNFNSLFLKENSNEVLNNEGININNNSGDKDYSNIENNNENNKNSNNSCIIT